MTQTGIPIAHEVFPGNTSDSVTFRQIITDLRGRFNLNRVIFVGDRGRRLIYTTNVIEGYHRQLRKVTKTKTAYPTDEALIKIIYLATVEASKKWTMPVRE